MAVGLENALSRDPHLRDLQRRREPGGDGWGDADSEELDGQPGFKRSRIIRKKEGHLPPKTDHSSGIGNPHDEPAPGDTAGKHGEAHGREGRCRHPSACSVPGRQRAKPRRPEPPGVSREKEIRGGLDPALPLLRSPQSSGPQQVGHTGVPCSTAGDPAEPEPVWVGSAEGLDRSDVGPRPDLETTERTSVSTQKSTERENNQHPYPMPFIQNDNNTCF